MKTEEIQYLKLLKKEDKLVELSAELKRLLKKYEKTQLLSRLLELENKYHGAEELAHLEAIIMGMVDALEGEKEGIPSDNGPKNEHYDIFLSHSIKDKEAISNELVRELRKRDLKVWYSGDQLEGGSSIGGEVNAAVSKSDFCVAILSPDYLSSEWTMKEFWTFYALETTRPNRIIPIWHNLTYEQLKKALPLASDRFAHKSSSHPGVIADKIYTFVRSKKYENPAPSFFYRIRQFFQNTTQRARVGIVGLLVGSIIGGGVFINNNFGEETAERVKSALTSIGEEMRKNFVNYTSSINYIRTGEIEEFIIPRRPSETIEAYEERARQYFFKYAKEANLARTSFPTSRSTYDSYKRDLSLDSDVLLFFEDVYKYFGKVDLIMNDYIQQLGELESRLAIDDKERVRRGRQLQAIKVLDMKIAMIDAAKSYARITQYDPLFPSTQFIMFWGVDLPSKDISYEDYDRLLLDLYQQREQILEKELAENPIFNPEAQKQESEDPAELMVLAAMAYLEGKGEAALEYLKQVLDSGPLSAVNDAYIRLSMDRIQEPDKYRNTLGAMVLEVEKGGNFESAGLKPGDLVLALEGETILEPYDLSQKIPPMQKESVILDVLRDDKEIRIAISGKKSLGAKLSQLVIYQLVQL